MRLGFYHADPKAPYVLVQTRSKKVLSRAFRKKGQVTVVACPSASGLILLPTIICDANNLSKPFLDN